MFLSDRFHTIFSLQLPTLTDSDNELFAGKPSTLSCRFGERGSVTAMSVGVEPTFVAVLTGAVRYILIPPSTAPSDLCVHSLPESALYRHSVLDLAHISSVTGAEQSSNMMPVEERECLKAVAAADAVEVFVKAGEVLYIPS